MLLFVGMAQYEYKELPFSLSDIEAAVQKHPTPFHLYNEQRIRENAATFTTEFRKYFPDFRNFFAVKATPNPHILKIVKQEGMGVDCSSLAELILAEKGMKYITQLSVTPLQWDLKGRRSCSPQTALLCQNIKKHWSWVPSLT